MNEQLILDFINNWRTSKGIPNDGSALNQTQLREFAVAVQGQLQQLSVRPSDPAGARVWLPNANPLGYSGSIEPNDIKAFKTAEAISKASGGAWYYISDTDACKTRGQKRGVRSCIDTLTPPVRANFTISSIAIRAVSKRGKS